MALHHFHVLGGVKPETALRWAWETWLVMAVIPAVVFIAAIWRVMENGAAGRSGAALAWWIGSGVFFALAFPAALFARARLFRCYEKGHAIPPGLYLQGMVLVWASLAAAGLVGAIGCLVTRTLLPNVGIAALPLFVFFAMWPNGNAMVHPTGRTDDPGTYEEAR